MIQLVHNGMNYKSFDSMDEVNNYIAEEVEKYARLSPKLIVNCKIGKYQLIVYQYSTLYCEMFMVEVC